MIKCKKYAIVVGMTIGLCLLGNDQLKAQGDQWVAAGNQASGKYEIYDPTVTDWNNTSALKWSFQPTTANGWTSAEVAAYSNPTDLKLRWSGANNVVVSSASGGLATIATYPGGVMKWTLNIGGSYNPHSVELLPNGNIAVAASSGNWIRVYASSQSSRNGTYAQFNLTGAHAVLWDPQNNVLWALGTTTLTALSVGGTAANPALSEVTSDNVTLPSSGGHDLSPYWGDPDLLWVTTSLNVYVYQKSTKTFTGAPGSADRTAVKGCGNQPSGEIVQCQIDNSACTLDTWCTPNVNFFTSAGSADYTRTRNGAAFYKCRIFWPDYQPFYPIHPVVLVGTNGAMSAFAIFSDGSVNTTWQSTAGGTWSSWASLGGSGMTALSGVILPDGCMALYACGGGAVWTTSQTNVGGFWQPWTSLGGNGFTQVKALAFSDNHMAVVGCGNGTAINYDVQNVPGGTWGGWNPIGNETDFTSLDAVVLGNQTVSAFGCGGADVKVSSQSTNNGSFSDWISVGGNGFTQIKSLVFDDDHMALIGCGNGTAVNYQAQPQPGGAWPGWVSLGGTGFSSIDGVINASQYVSVFGCGGNAVYTAWQSTTNGSFSGWTSLGGSGFYTVTGVILPTGVMSAFGGAAGTPLWTIWQNSDGGTWSNWTSLGGTLR